MNTGHASFEACIRAPSPAPNFLTMPAFGAQAHVGLAVQSTQFPPTPVTSNSIETTDSSIYSRPYSMESTGSRAVNITVPRI